MRRLPLFLLCLVFIVLLAVLPTPTAAQTSNADVQVTQIDTSHYPDVTLYVAVTDSAGQPVTSLRQRDFSVTEDGTPVTIADFSGSGGPINTALVLDHSNSMRYDDKLESAQDAAQVFVDQMRPGDRTALIAFDEDPQTVERLTSNQATLSSTIDRIRYGSGTAIYDSVIAGVDALRNVEGRRVLLVLTDGQDCRDIDDYNCPADYGSRASRDEAITYANQHEQPLYVVGLGDRSNNGIDEKVLRRLADETYGEYFYAPYGNELVDLYARLSGNVQQEYALTYTSPRPFYDGTRRDIEVSIQGTAASASSAYVERHLINIHANMLVGLLLLLPLLGLLLLPTLAQRVGLGKRQPAASPQARNIPVEFDDDSPPSASYSAPSAPPSGEQQVQTGAPASGITSSGVQATDTGPQRPGSTAAFCDQCGTALRPNARFCGSCGAKIGEAR